jgi:hypothetical protein
VFIELTDHLRCPQDHDEAFLVLIPERMEGRRVIAGHLGCPACGWGTAWVDGVPDFGESPAATNDAPPFDAESAIALIGIDGPGGWLAVAGRLGALAHEIAARLPHVNLVAVNPPHGVESSGAVSVIRSGAWPIKQHAMRGALVGVDAAGFAARAIGSVLPGLRAAGEGERPTLPVGSTTEAEAPGLWVVRR